MHIVKDYKKKYIYKKIRLVYSEYYNLLYPSNKRVVRLNVITLFCFRETIYTILAI